MRLCAVIAATIASGAPASTAACAPVVRNACLWALGGLLEEASAVSALCVTCCPLRDVAESRLAYLAYTTNGPAPQVADRSGSRGAAREIIEGGGRGRCGQEE